MQHKEKVRIEALIEKECPTVWRLWTAPEHITKWNQASDDWHSPRAENDLRVGGKFSSRMEAKDGSMGFDFSGSYDVVKPCERIAYTLDDGRKVNISFIVEGKKTKITQVFEADGSAPIDMQRTGWQAILNNFKRYAENH